jgi:hypothetical protein
MLFAKITLRNLTTPQLFGKLTEVGETKDIPLYLKEIKYNSRRETGSISRLAQCRARNIFRSHQIWLGSGGRPLRGSAVKWGKLNCRKHTQSHVPAGGCFIRDEASTAAAVPRDLSSGMFCRTKCLRAVPRGRFIRTSPVRLQEINLCVVTELYTHRAVHIQWQFSLTPVSQTCKIREY